MPEEGKKTIEVRGFLQLDAHLRKKYGSIPVIMELEEPIKGTELAEKMNVSWDEVEVIFVNGFVQALDYVIHPGDRVAFLPPGCPGPYRLAMGFYGKNQGNPANFKIKGRE
ncbi:MoaD/ThiS family protein [Clostridium formicaceticum]|uniref:Thiamine S protein n=1 Tax=Clostridium formicaceticum TaxID=1497 RepID=A0AAC9RRD5_9CLOT|nr:MoaD/ThiS family protein [Clostridium formicaceticum]AOY75217.1 thiamine S protein [Clostridium formicaceticum]ARE89650.1 hypothetical protein CLFO_41310 [Clostridium formicaceticum]